MRGAAVTTLALMISSACLVRRWWLGRWLLGLVLVVANSSVWASVDHAVGAGQRLGQWAESAAVAPLPMQVAHDVVARGVVLRVLAVHGTNPAEQPCGHAIPAAGALGGGPCISGDSPCAGLCAAVCLPATGAGPALPFASAELSATVLTEARPQRSGWTGTGRIVPPESPPPIV